MQISFAAPKPVVSAGSWVVGACEGGALMPAAVRADKASGGALTRGLKVSRFTGKSGQTLEVLAPVGLSVSRILLVGLGKPEAVTLKSLEIVAAQSVARLNTLGETSATFEIEAPQTVKKGEALKSTSVATHMAFGAKLRSYSFDKYRTKNLDEHKRSLAQLTIVVKDAAAAKKGYAASLAGVADGIFLARDLVNEPPNILYPAEFARRAKALGRLGVKVEVLGEAQMKKLGFGALLGGGPGQCAREPACRDAMEWHEEKGRADRLCRQGRVFRLWWPLVEPGGGMMGMKGDMAGAAAVTGAMMALATRKARSMRWA